MWGLLVVLRRMDLFLVSMVVIMKFFVVVIDM